GCSDLHPGVVVQPARRLPAGRARSEVVPLAGTPVLSKMFVPAAADRSGSRRTERRRIVRRTLGALSVGVLAVALAATGCSKTTTSTGTNGKGPTAQTGGIGTAAQSKGPAKAVAGAVKGGTITVTSQQDFEHLDPQRVYVTDGQEAGGLIYRSLTSYVD